MRSAAAAAAAADSDELDPSRGAARGDERDELDDAERDDAEYDVWFHYAIARVEGGNAAPAATIARALELRGSWAVRERAAQDGSCATESLT